MDRKLRQENNKKEKRRTKLNAQKHQFRIHFRANTATHTGQAAKPPQTNETTATNSTSGSNKKQKKGKEREKPKNKNEKRKREDTQ